MFTTSALSTGSEWLNYHCRAGFFLEIILGSRSSLNLHRVGLALKVCIYLQLYIPAEDHYVPGHMYVVNLRMHIIYPTWCYKSQEVGRTATMFLICCPAGYCTFTMQVWLGTRGIWYPSPLVLWARHSWRRTSGHYRQVSVPVEISRKKPAWQL